MKAHMIFDTLAYANRLKAAGMEPKMAEVQAETNAEMIANLFDDRATKQDLATLRSDLKSDIATVKSDLEYLIASKATQQDLAIAKSDLEHLIVATRQDLAATKSDLEHQIAHLRAEVKQDMKDLEIRLTIRLGAIMAGGLAIMMAMVRLT